MEPYWLYFSSIGIFTLTALLITSVYKKINKTLYWLFLLTLCAFLFYHSQKQLAVGRDELTYTEYWLKKSPDNLLARGILGELYIYNPIPISNDLILPMINNTKIYVRDNHQDLALKLGEKILLKTLPTEQRIDMLSLMAAAHEKNGDPIKSRKIVNQLITTNSNPNIYIQISSIFDQVAMPDEAIKILDQCLNVYPQFKEAYLLKGIILGNQDKYEASIKVWEKGLEVDSKDTRFMRLIEDAQKLYSLREGQSSSPKAMRQ
ncbi:MAG: hypothetical protein HQL26_01605 [Candidatus Omnitrophica bacterium]|nr:hypothetical protein [Candidatus Omnitrophota bacterium]